MQWLIDILKSRGKLGAVGLIVLGVGHMAAVFFGGLAGGYETGGAIVLGGLSLLGIRSAQDPVNPPK